MQKSMISCVNPKVKSEGPFGHPVQTLIFMFDHFKWLKMGPHEFLQLSSCTQWKRIGFTPQHDAERKARSVKTPHLQQTKITVV